MSDIPAGYMLQITTWENDGDNYSTKTLAGLTEDQVRFNIFFVSMFKSENGWSQDPNEIRLGNSDRGEDASEILDLAFNKFKEAGNYIPSTWDRTHPDNAEYINDKHFYYDLIYDLIGSWNDGGYNRVFESYKVYDVPEPILDVTSQFKI